MSEAERLANLLDMHWIEHHRCHPSDAPMCEAAAAELRRLSAELAEVRKQMDAQKDEWLSWDAKRSALEKDSERLDWLAVNPVDALDLFGRVTGDFTNWPKWIRGDIDAAMKGTQ